MRASPAECCHGMCVQVDVLFVDETFKLAPIGTCAPDDTQFIFVTATLPQVCPMEYDMKRRDSSCLVCGPH